MKDALTDLASSVIIVSFLVWLYRKKQFPEIGYGVYNDKGKCVRQLFTGCLVGLFCMTVILLISSKVSAKKIVVNDSISIIEVILWLISYIAVGVEEEMFFRGFAIGVFQKVKFGTAYCIFASSIIFAIAHLGNEGISLLALINLFLFGTICAILYYATQNLCITIGIHITWNFFEAMFGFNVSGFTVPYIVRVEGSLPDFIGGGTFGPEGGIVVSGLLAVLLIGLLCYGQRKKYIQNKKEASAL